MGDPYVVLGYAVTYGSMLAYAAALVVRLRRRTELARSIGATSDSEPRGSASP